jgi:hypothetical protein
MDADTASKVVEVADSQRRAFLVEMRGYSLPGPAVIGHGRGIVPGTANGVLTHSSWLINRVLPQRHSLQYPWLYCSGADLLSRYGNHRGAPGDSVFDTARYRLNYSARKYQLIPNSVVWPDNVNGELLRFIERDNNASGESIPVPSGSFKWVTAPNDAIQEGGVPKVFPVQELVYTMHQVPGAMMPNLRGNVRDLLGRVNYSTFDSTIEGGGGNGGLGFQIFARNPRFPANAGMPTSTGYPRGTVLLIGFREEVVKPIDYFVATNGMINGSLAFVLQGLTTMNEYRVKFHFLVRNNGTASVPGANPNSPATVWYGWNYLFRGPSFNPMFQLVTHNGTASGSPIYLYGFFERLFRFPNPELFSAGLF